MTDKKSIISEASSTDRRSGGGAGAGAIFDDTEEIELQQRLERFERDIAVLTLENLLFETALERKKSEPATRHVSSSLTHSIPETPHDSTHDLMNSSGTSRSERLVRKRSKSRSTQGDFRIQLTLEQKVDIVLSEYEHTKAEKSRCEIENEKQIDQFESDLEWIDGEIIDCQLSSADFLKMRNSSIDKRTHKLIGEKLDHYFNERIKGRTSLINKLRDRSSGHKRQILHLDIEIRHSQEIGETLNEVDFMQLKLENKQYLDTIDEKNHDLVSLKQKVVQFTKNFNHYKDELQAKIQDLIDMQERLESQQALHERVQQELKIVNYELARAVRQRSILMGQMENYHVPEILDYVRKKALLYKLQRDCEVWQRKVEIVSMGLKQTKQKWKELRRTAGYLGYTTTNYE